MIADRSVEAVAAELKHREVVVRNVGPVGRTVIRSSIVDVAIDDDTDVIEVEVAAETGYLFPLSTVTFIDDEDDAAAQ